jgi:hypothetical protein
MNEEKREILETPFPTSLRRTRRGGHGRELTYVETHNYIRRLNQAFEGDWSFNITEHTRTDDEVIVLGRLCAGGVEKAAFGGSNLTRNRETGTPVSLADDLKAAASDALKKAASLLGIGLDLYSETTEQPAVPPAPLRPQTRTEGEGDLLTERQHRAILGLSSKNGLSEAELGRWVQSTYGAPLDKLDQRNASEVITKLNQYQAGDNGRAAGGAA